MKITSAQIARKGIIRVKGPAKLASPVPRLPSQKSEVIEHPQTGTLAVLFLAHKVLLTIPI